MGFIDDFKKAQEDLKAQQGDFVNPANDNNKVKIGLIVLLLVIGFFYFFNREGEHKTETQKTVKNTQLSEKVIEPFYTIQQKKNDYYIPENTVINYYNWINKRDWVKMEKITLKRFDKDFLKDNFQYFTIKGLEILSVEKPQKYLAIVKANITYTNVTDKIETKQVKVRLERATDLLTWIVSPLTVY